jgi:signal transduction histidine kinase
MERLDELLETFAGAGLEVRTTANWPLGDMDRACDLAAFRIIQESLTNASKHGADGQAKLTLISAADGLTIGVSNLVTMGQAASSSTRIPTPVGHGLMGMRERAAACGGSLSARLDDHGVFSVLATIPHRPLQAPAVSTTGVPAGRHRGRARREGSA